MQREFSRAVKDKKHPFRLVILGSQKDAGVGLRYIVLREYATDDRMLFYTDARTPKVAEIRNHPGASLLFYHPQKGLQIRVEGQMKLHQNDSLSQEHWKRVQGIGRRAYTPHLEPGKIIDSPNLAHKWPEEMSDEHFTVLEFTPHSFDLLQLNRLEHLRLGMQKRDEGWEMNWLAP